MDEEQLTQHVMSLKERETLKEFARRGENLEQIVIIIAHWMSCAMDVSFSGYAAQWAAANTKDDLSALRKQWPLESPRMIADNSTAWGSYMQNF